MFSSFLFGFSPPCFLALEGFPRPILRSISGYFHEIEIYIHEIKICAVSEQNLHEKKTACQTDTAPQCFKWDWLWDGYGTEHLTVLKIEIEFLTCWHLTS